MCHDILAINSEFGGDEPTMRIQIHSVETSGLRGDDVCPICREEFGAICDAAGRADACFVPGAPHMNIARLPCGHHFSIFPLVTWFAIKNMRCPMCREGPNMRLSVACLPRHIRAEFRDLQNAHGGSGVEAQDLQNAREQGGMEGIRDVDLETFSEGPDVDIEQSEPPSWAMRELAVTCPSSDVSLGDEPMITMRVEDREGGHVHAESFFLRGTEGYYIASPPDYFTAMMWLRGVTHPHFVTFELYRWHEGTEVLVAKSPSQYIPLLPSSPFVFMENHSTGDSYSVHWC